MSTTSQQFISGFDTLPLLEQRDVAAEILRKAANWECPPLSDDDLARLADDVFLELDRREADDGSAR
jgi:hypothetical protein